jgi:hypothetical protein
MPDAHDALLEGAQTVFDTLADLFYPAGTTVTLQSQSPTTNAFTDILMLTTLWWMEYLDYRQQFRLEIARDDSTLTTAMATATHVKIASDIYEIVQADTLPPKGVDVTWKIFCTRFATRSTFEAIY